LFREEWLEICRVRVISWVFNLHWLTFVRTLYDEYTRLVPDTAKELPSRQQGDLRNIFSFENFVFSKGESLLIENAEEHTVATAEAELVWSISLDDLVDVSC